MLLVLSHRRFAKKYSIKDNQVIGLDNLNNYYDIRLKKWRLAQLESIRMLKILLLLNWILKIRKIRSIFSKKKSSLMQCLILLPVPAFDTAWKILMFIFTTNAVGTLNLLESMRAQGSKKIVLASTSSLYAGQKIPFTEDLAVNEPLSPYAASKKAAELMAYSYHKLYGIDVSVVRYFTVYGPAGRPDMSPYRFIKWITEGETIQLFGDGSQSRDFTYVNDIATGTVAAMQDVGYEIINLGGGRSPISLTTIISKLEVLIGRKAKIDYKPFHVADLMETWADITKAKNLLGWEPKTCLDIGLENTVHWYMDNRCWLNKLAV